jgi:L-serine dehydratase
VNTSLFELFKIGIGPSSSHTVGPMRAALRFTRQLASSNLLDRTARVNVDLYGSLALTGIGHGTDRAILLGLLGEAPDSVDPATVEPKIAAVRSTGHLTLNGTKTIPFIEIEDLHFRRTQMYPDTAVPSHPNGMRFTASDENGVSIADEVFYSVGGGFILSHSEFMAERDAESATSTRIVPYPFRSAAELLATAKQHNLTIAELLLANEVALLNDPTIHINRPKSHSDSTPILRSLIAKGGRNKVRSIRPRQPHNPPKKKSAPASSPSGKPCSNAPSAASPPKASSLEASTFAAAPTA